MSVAFSRRPGHLHGINARVEMHGEEATPAMDISLEMLISTAELDQLRGAHCADRWFNTKDGKLAEPADKDLRSFKQKGKFDNSQLNLWVGVNDELFAFDGKITGVTYQPQFGGWCGIKFRMQTLIDVDNLPIFLWMGREAAIEVSFGELLRETGQAEMELQPGEAPKAEA